MLPGNCENHEQGGYVCAERATEVSHVAQYQALSEADAGARATYTDADTQWFKRPLGAGKESIEY